MKIPKNKLSVAEFIVKKIESWKIRDVPVFQGGAIMNVLSEIGKSKKINFYCPYHEQALAMAVDAYSRLKGMGVGFVTSGPGATNLITGVACSYYDSIPVIFFSGQVGQFHITGKRNVRQRGFQESDVVSLFKPITKFSYQIKDANEIDYILDKAYFEATNGRPGPVLIDLPFNIQKTIIQVNKLKKFKPPREKNKDIKKINGLIKLLNSSMRPLFIAGGGLRVSYQTKKFLGLVNKKNIPFITTWAAQDIVNTDHKLYSGSLGRHAHLSASNLAKNADLIITFGVRFSPKIVTKYFAENSKVISIDIDYGELSEGLFNPNIKINLDLKKFFLKLDTNKIKKFNQKKWLSSIIYEKKNNFRNFLELSSKESNKFVNPNPF